MLLRSAIGQVVRRLRRERAKTLQQLSEEARVSLPYISEIERGRKEASSEILQVLCVALGVSLEAFLLEVSDVLAEGATPAMVVELRSVRDERPVASSLSAAPIDSVLLAA